MRFLWVHAWALRRPGNASETRWAIDSLVEFAAGRFDTLLVSATDLGDGRDGYCLGESRYFRVAGERIDGLTIWSYLYERARAAGLQVHPWWVVGPWAVWRALITPLHPTLNMASASGAPCNAVAWLNFDYSAARALVANVVGDFAATNPTDGTVLDYIRYDRLAYGCSMSDDWQITNTVKQVRQATPGLPVSIATVGECVPAGYDGSTCTNTHQNARQMFEAGMLGRAILMAYARPVSIRHEFIQSMPGPVVPGLSLEPGIVDAEAKAIGFLRQFRELGYEDFAVFAWPWVAQKAAFLAELGTQAPPLPVTITLPASAVEAAREGLNVAAEILNDQAGSYNTRAGLLEDEARALREQAANLQEMAEVLAGAAAGLGAG